jgi:glycosyltransferase involved in cell wall biosynthesis
MLRVGINTNSAFVRRYTDLPHTHVRIVRTYDPVTVFNGARERITRRPAHATDFQITFHIPPSVPPVDLLHLFNRVSTGRKPWVATYEHYLPRWDPSSRWGMRFLERSSCRKVIAMSDFAFRTQRAYMDRFHPRSAAVTSKTVVIHPAQPAVIDRYDEKDLPPSTIDFTFIGREFFRKGGREALLACSRLVREGVPIRLNIVSSLESGDHVTHATKEDVDECLRIISDMGDRATHYWSLDTQEVYALLRKTHVGLLPTTVETYGFSVLESQATGCPVISTHVCALPEMNPDPIGWRIPVPIDSLGVPLVETPEQRRTFTATVVDALCAIIREIVRNPEAIRAKGERSLEAIKTHYAPRDRASTMEAIYEAAVRDAGTDRPAVTDKGLR